MCTWLGFRPIYDTFLHNPKGYHTSMTPTLFIHSKSADHLKVTWYIKRLEKYGLQKYPGGGGGEFDTKLESHIVSLPIIIDVPMRGQ